MIAIPLGLGSAIYLSEFAPSRVRDWLKPILEILAGIPSVVYGYFALTFVTPLLQPLVPGLEIFNALSAGIVVGIMVLPLIASLSEDAMSAVPRGLRQGAYALGATKFEVSTRVVTLPRCRGSSRRSSSRSRARSARRWRSCSRPA